MPRHRRSALSYIVALGASMSKEPPVVEAIRYALADGYDPQKINGGVFSKLRQIRGATVKPAALALAGLLLAGCASAPVALSEQESAKQRDMAECEQRAGETFRAYWRQRSLGGFAFGLYALGLYIDAKRAEDSAYRACMVSRGYPATPPPAPAGAGPV